MTESTPKKNAEEPVTNTIEFSPIGNGDETTNNTRNNKRRLTNEENFAHGKVGGDGRNETERKRGDNNSD